MIEAKSVKASEKFQWEHQSKNQPQTSNRPRSDQLLRSKQHRRNKSVKARRSIKPNQTKPNQTASNFQAAEKHRSGQKSKQASIQTMSSMQPQCSVHAVKPLDQNHKAARNICTLDGAHQEDGLEDVILGMEDHQSVALLLVTKGFLSN
jgi:hypothetical protein